MWLQSRKIFSILKCIGRYSTEPAPSKYLSNLWQNEHNLILPEKLMKKKHKYQDHLYLNNLEGAKIIAEHILRDIIPNTTFLEVNPGNGFLTSYLVNNDNIKELLLYELYSDFLPKFNELHSIYPDKVKVKHGDFINIWKLEFRDKLDNGIRMQDFLEFIPKMKYSDDINMKVFGCFGSQNFFKHLINSLVFGTSLFSYGRCEINAVVPYKLFTILTCNQSAGYAAYRPTTVLFQIMFEYKLVCKIPKAFFFPQLYDNPISKKRNTKKVDNKSDEEDYLYLLNLVPRKNLYDVCSLENIPAFWYFVKQSLVSRKSRIIPYMEKWIPGCGPRIILNMMKPKPLKNIYENETFTSESYAPCKVISTEDFHPDINIFTEFGELSPTQILSLFIQFQKWPEYKESPFVAALETNLLKIEQASEENVDGGIELIEPNLCKDSVKDENSKNSKIQLKSE